MNTAKKSLEGLGRIKRRAVDVGQLELVRERSLEPRAALPLVLEPTVPGVNLVSWGEGHRDDLRRRLLEHGGILFRGFKVGGVGEFERFIAAVAEPPLEYRERSSPRSQVQGNVYTSTDYPPEYEIFLHNENSYQHAFPLKIFFYCVTAPRSGGETPIADCRKVCQRLDPEVRRRFAEKRWMYRRNFGDGFGLPWETVFQTRDRGEVEEHCRRHGIETEWREGNRLRVRAVRPALARHPESGELVWFNHAAFFHVSTLEPEVREALLADFEEDELPTNTYYGDGAPIADEVLEQLRAAYRSETVRFPWEEEDVLMLDNMLVAHGRAAYAGPRKIVVGMSEPRGWEDLELAEG